MKMPCLMRWLLLLALLNTGQYGSYAQEFSSSNLPVVIIDTDGAEIVDEPKINASMGIINNGSDQRNNLTDPFNDFDGTVGIEVRGSSSQLLFPKKQYSVEVRNPDSSDSTVSLLGMPAESDWVLYAPYSDKSLMRNILAYQLGRDLGHYAPRTRLCEVVLNDQYQGVFVLTEKIKRDKDRVDIARLKDDEVSGDDLTGGYIIKIDKDDRGTEPGWASEYTPRRRSGDQQIIFRHEYPDLDDIVPEQQAYIQQFVADFEDALAGDDFADPAVGYAQYIDVNSFVDYLIANEVARNPDAYRISTFLHKQKDSDGGKLVMGPIWDFNLGFGNVDFCLGGDPKGLVLRYNSVCSDDFWLIPFWWGRFMEDPTFVERVNERWTELRAGPLATERIGARIDSVATLLGEAKERNFVRWPVLGEYVWPNAYVGQTYAQEVQYLKNWTRERLDWLDANLVQELALVTDLPAETEARPPLLYPNPFGQKLWVEFTTLEAGTAVLQLYDPLGRVVLNTTTFLPTQGEQQLPINTERLAPGTYILQLRVNDHPLVTRRLSKQ